MEVVQNDEVRISTSRESDYETSNEIMLKDTNIKIRKALESLKWVKNGNDSHVELRPDMVTEIELHEDIPVYCKIASQG